MSEPKVVTLEPEARYFEHRGAAGGPRSWKEAAAKLRAADRVVAVARKRCKRPDGSGCDCELCQSIVDLDRAGGGA